MLVLANAVLIIGLLDTWTRNEAAPVWFHQNVAFTTGRGHWGVCRSQVVLSLSVGLPWGRLDSWLETKTTGLQDVPIFYPSLEVASHTSTGTRLPLSANSSPARSNFDGASACHLHELGRALAVGQNQWYHFGVGAPPILVYFSGDWDVHWGYGILTHGHLGLHLSRVGLMHRGKSTWADDEVACFRVTMRLHSGVILTLSTQATHKFKNSSPQKDSHMRNVNAFLTW